MNEDMQRLMQMYNCHDKEQLLDRLVKAEIERLKYEEMRHELESLLLIEQKLTPEQRERFKVLDESLCRRGYHRDSIAMIEADRFIQRTIENMRKKQRHGEGE